MLWQSNDARPAILGPVHPEHPLAQGLMGLILFHEGGGQPQLVYTAIQGRGSTTTPAPAFLDTTSASPAPTWVNGPYGVGAYCSGTGSFWNVVAIDEDMLPTSRCTIAFIRRKVDTTLRASTTFGATTVDISRCGTHCPYSDGTVYFDFGGSTGANRLTKTGLTFTTDIERWVFVAGTRGSAFYRNGILLNSQSTGISRVNGGTAAFSINTGNGVAAGDIQEFYFFGIWDAEWTQNEVLAWDADPYGLVRWDPHMNRQLYAFAVPTVTFKNSLWAWERFGHPMQGF